MKSLNPRQIRILDLLKADSPTKKPRVLRSGVLLSQYVIPGEGHLLR